MYPNLIKAIKKKEVTYAQIAEAMGYQELVIRNCVNGISEKDFSYEEAVKVQKLFFNEYDLEWLFAARDQN